MSVPKTPDRLDELIPALEQTTTEISRLLESVAHDPDWRPSDEHWSFRHIAAEFWRGNRRLSAAAIEHAYADAGEQPPAAPERLAAAMIALDIGLALQHFVDPRGVPLEAYPELYELLFGTLDPGVNGR